MFVKRFPDMLLDDFVMPAVVTPSRETAMPTEAGDGAASHPPGEKGSVSTWCDVYSYGIMLMEMLTRKTDDMFAGDMNLKRWVKESLPDTMTEVIDANLLGQESEHYSAKLECVSSIMVLALECSAQSPDQRINMNDVLVKLKKIRVKL
ncbi:hypothetical protein RJ640_027930, partial [Escallonia rubra]